MTTHRLPRRPRKLVRSLAAAALALPLSVAALGAPATAASATASTALVDRWAPYSSNGYGYVPGYVPGYGVPSYGPSYGAVPGYGGYGYAPGSGSTTSSSTAGLDVSDATTTESAGLVEITSTIDYDAGTAAGTGIILSGDGLVVTNHHVVEGATSISVTDVATGTTYVADVLGYDVAKDVAVLQLEDASGLTPVTTDADGLALGDAVTAVGDAGGDGGTLTAAPGTVTDLHDSITVTDEETSAETPLHNLVEVTSDVVPGDSGGALLDAAGDVVGMNVAASSGSTDVTGYVIPIRRVLKVVAAIEAGDAGGTTTIGSTAFLGVQLATGSTAATLAGTVADSPAEELGLAAGDTVTTVDGQAVASADELSEAIATHDVGDAVTVTWTDASGATGSGTATLVGGPVS